MDLRVHSHCQPYKHQNQAEDLDRQSSLRSLPVRNDEQKLDDGQDQ